MSGLKNYISEIVEKMEAGKAVLFLGAGASAAADAPLQKELVDLIKGKYPKLDPNKHSLLEVCQDFIETPGYNRKDLEEFITQKFKDLKPTMAHMRLTKYNWPAIFTTNFDDLIETAYRISEKPLKNCFVVSYPSESPIRDAKKVYLFKIMGTILTRAENKMVLCRSDYIKMIKKRSDYLKHLEDFVKDGTIIFVGYSAKDNLVTDIMDEVIEETGLERLPWSYILLKDLELSEKDRYRYKSHKMIPLKCSFEEFFEKLEKTDLAELPLVQTLAQSEKIRIEGRDLFITKRELEISQEYFEILHDGLLHGKPRKDENFFKGSIGDYSYYAKNLDFKRDIYSKPHLVDGRIIRSSLKDRIMSELENRDMTENRVILIKGLPGVGKSVLLHRIAHDVYASGKAPVIVFDRARMFFDYKLLSSILVKLDRKFDRASEGHEGHRLKSLIIIDDLAVDPFLVKDYLSSRGRLALIIVAGRENEIWDTLNFTQPDTYILPEYLSPDEKKRIIEHLFNLGYVNSTDETWDYLLDKEFENSFFATIYSLVLHSRKPLNEIIIDQYVKLNPISQKAFSLICAFHQFNLPINLELLVRALKCSYEEVYNEVLPNTRGLIFEESSGGYLLYTTHHRIIAKKTLDFFFNTTKKLQALFLEVLSDINLKNSKEREIIQKLLVRHLSSGSQSTDLNRLEKIAIFEKICSQYETKALLHHLGVLLSDEGNYSAAKEKLKRALTIHEGGRRQFRSELDQNILTSLGVVHSRIAAKYAKEKFASRFIEEETKLAENYFLKARFGGWPNAHSYHAHANMFIQIGDLVENALRKTHAYAKSLSILQDAKDNLNQDQLQMIYELETCILERIGKMELGLEKAAQIAEKFNSARGYTLLASRLIHKSDQFATWAEKEPLLRQARSIVETAAKEFPTDEYVLILKAKLTKRLEPSDENLYFESLQAWYNNARSPNIWLLFELGVTAFKVERYEYSRKIFRKLENERLSGGLRTRYREFMYLTPRRKPKKFVGVIVSIENRYEGFIRCDTLRNLGYPLHFRPIACDFQPLINDMVEFYIVFDFLGPRAIRVKRI